VIEKSICPLFVLGNSGDIIHSEGRITSGIYQENTGVSRQTATRDLEGMVKKGILEQRGERRGAFYVRVKGMPQL
jgi:predicted HTH transcriptional regulator